MTKLEAVNQCLRTIRQRPISTLSGTLDDEAGLALEAVELASKDVQAEREWWFNTSWDGTFTPVSGAITTAAEVLSCTFPDTNDFYFAWRSGVLWKIAFDGTESDTFVSPVSYSTLTVARDFEDLPHNAQRYISLRAARVFSDQILSDGQPTRSATVEESQARSALITEHMKMRKPNMLKASGIREIAMRPTGRPTSWLV